MGVAIDYTHCNPLSTRLVSSFSLLLSTGCGEHLVAGGGGGGGGGPLTRLSAGARAYRKACRLPAELTVSKESDRGR